MTGALPTAALSLSDRTQEYGAYAGLAAVVGLAVLSLLYFAQAREVKRLRDWAGRAPERAAEAQAAAAARAAGAPRTLEAPPPEAASPAPVAPATAGANGGQSGPAVPATAAATAAKVAAGAPGAPPHAGPDGAPAPGP